MLETLTSEPPDPQTSEPLDPNQAMQALTEEDGVQDIGLLEPDPKHYCKALQHQWLAPLWEESDEEEMEGLFRRGCFKKH
eukprot:1614724-Rhodomonas_salina.1